MQTYESLFIGGRWEAPTSAARIPVHSSSTEDVIGSVPAGSAEDVSRAVTAARRAFDAGWAFAPPGERAEWLRKLADGLEKRKQDIASVISQEVGMPISMSLPIQAGTPVVVLRSFADLAASWPFERNIGHSLILREPVGVVGAITPWNYPLHQIIAKVAPALAAGCTLVLKPSELAPLNAGLLAEVCEEISLPAGLINIVNGYGPEVGEAIASHPGIDMVSFTGSVRAGTRVASVAAATVKKVTLELGGKSACVILEDAAFDKAVSTGVKNAMLNSGQTCSAWSRMIVPRDKMDDAVSIAQQTLAKLPLGDPLDQATRLGPLISEAQRKRVEDYIAAGRAEGARLAIGGGRPSHLPKGHYVEPTVFRNVTPDMKIAREEIFGPVLSILPYESEDEAVAIANDSIYGLAGAVWSEDAERALRVARRIRTGQVDINGARWNPLAPFGGYKQSGIGREFGEFGLEEYLQVKSVAR
ncbi:MAG TPA: aldehyde dehydrogenase family protein [Thermoanaerobaculia bacterium]